VGAGTVEAVLLLESGAPEKAGIEGGKPVATEPPSRIDKIRQLLDQVCRFVPFLLFTLLTGLGVLTRESFSARGTTPL
jgi:hypothetical protein